MFTLSVFPLPVAPDGRGPLGLSPGFAPRGYPRRTPGWGRALDTGPGLHLRQQSILLSVLPLVACRFVSHGRVAGGVAPPGPHRSVRDSLPSHGSCHLDHQNEQTHAQWAKVRDCWRVMRCQHAAALLRARSRLNLLRSQRTR
jgi:hypothetical protein